MNSSDEVAILRQTYTFFSTHRDALKDVLQDLDLRNLTATGLSKLLNQLEKKSSNISLSKKITSGKGFRSFTLPVAIF
jgi:hypothetical protein